MVGDLAENQFCRTVVDGCEAIVHLAANASPSVPWDEVIGNITMADHLLRAAQEFSVGRIVLASSVHASGLHYRDGVSGIDTAAAPRPCCAYGTGKVTVEALARLHQDENGNAVSCLRLGLTGWPLVEREYAETWFSTHDLLALVDAALGRKPGFGIYHGVSVDSAHRWSMQNAVEDLGWAPQDHWPVDPRQMSPATFSPCQLFRVEQSERVVGDATQL